MTKTAQELADAINHELQWLESNRAAKVAGLVDRLLSLAQASQARTDGGAVAWMDDEGRVLSREQMHNAMNHQGGPGRIVAAKYSTPLFPPGNATQAAGAREPLTLEEIGEIGWGAACVGLDWDTRVAAVRAVEVAHGIASPAAELKKD